MVLASIDQIPEELIDNAIVLGCLSFFVAFVFLFDLSERMGKRRTDGTQTDTSSIDRHNKSTSMTTLNSQANLMDSDGNERRNRDSMRLNGQREAEVQTVAQSSNPFVNYEQSIDPMKQKYILNVPGENYVVHQQDQHQHFQPHSQPHSVQSMQQFPQTTYMQDFVETQTLPTVQTPVFSKVKQPPTVINHLETEPYKKILSRTNQQPLEQSPYSRYQDQAQQHHDPSFYDDFNSYRKQTYYQGPKVDQGKLVIRDYSQQPTKHSCNCQNHDEEEVQDENSAIKSGYVSQVAKLWDSRMKPNQGSIRSQQKDVLGLNTVV